MKQSILLALVGSALATATLHSSPAPHEIRALWAQAWAPDLHTPEGIDAMIANAAAANINTLIPQMRRRGDTLYFSDIEPRASGVQAGFDALEYLIEKAHAQNPPMEVHAWIVTYPIGTSSDPDHTSNRNPDWLMLNSNGESIDQHDPGHPGVQQHLLEVSMELIGKYPIDGLHFDYIRYPEYAGAWGYNPVSVKRFQRLYNRSDTPGDSDPEWREFRRDQVTQMLRRVYLHAIEARPEIKISAATITWGHSGVANIDEWWSSSAYAGVYQDWRGWMEEGILDLNIPMNYYREHNNTPPEDHAQAYRNWSAFAKDHKYNRHLAIGPGIYLNTIPNSITQIRETRKPTASSSHADGVALYTYHATNCYDPQPDGTCGWTYPRETFYDALVNPSQFDSETPVFAAPAAIPEMPWKTSPTTGHLKGYVRDALTGDPIDGARVELSGDLARTIQTDSHGFYGFVDLPPGNYTLTASWDRAPADTPPMMSSVSKGNVSHQDLYFLLPGYADGAEVIVDNGDEEVGFSGNDWRTTEAAGGYGPDYRWTHTSAHGEYAGPHTATYTPGIPEAGLYRIDTQYRNGTNRTSQARYTVSDGSEEEAVFINQQVNGGEWVTVTEQVFLDPADGPSVTIDNSGPASVVMADAVRWVLLVPDEEATAEFSITTEVVGPGRLEGIPESGQVRHGQRLEIQAVADDGFRLSHWEGNAWGNANPLHLDVGGDLHLRATFVSPYRQWAEEHFGEEGEHDPSGDPGSHGIPNLLRFAFDLDPHRPDRAALPRLDLEEKQITLTYRRRTDQPGVAYRVETSHDLAAWKELEPPPAVKVEPLSGQLEQVSLSLPADARSRFIRLHIDLPAW